MSLATRVDALADNITEHIGVVKGQFNKWNGQVQAQIKKLEDWKISLFKTKTMTIENGSYRTIAKFNSSRLTCSFRLVISGTYGNFVFGGLYDVVTTHLSRLDIVEVVSSHYGKIKLKITVDYGGNGFVEMMTESGNGGIHSLQIGLIPYVGSIVHTDEAVDYANKEVYEMAYE